MLSRRNLLLGCSFVALLSGQASGWIRGYPGVSATAKTVLNAYPDNVGNGRSYMTINLMKLCTGFTSSQSNYPSILDSNNYPNSGTVTADLQINGLVLPQNYAAGSPGTFVIKWAGTAGAFKLTSGGNGNINVSSSVDVTVAGDGTTTLTLTQSGANPKAVISFSAPSSFVSPGVYFPSGKTYTNMNSLVFCRSDQEALHDAGEIFNPDLIAFQRDLNPKVLRVMDLCAVNANPTNAGFNAQHAYRAPSGALMYGLARWEPTAWVGDLGQTGDAYSCSAPSGWGGLVDGATVIGRIVTGATGGIAVSAAANNGSGLIRLTVASTASLSTGQRVGITRTGGGAGIASGVWAITVIDGTHIDLQNSVYTSESFAGTLGVATLDVASSGAKPVSGINGGSGGIPSNFIGTFIYNAVRDCWLLGGTSNGIQCGVPIEVLVALANKLRVNLWVCFNLQYTDNSVSSTVQYVRDNLNSTLTAYYELSNEIWNTGFYQFQWATYAARALALNSGAVYSYQGLRHRQIMAIVTSSYAAVGRTNYKRVLAFQEFGDLSSNGNTQKYLWDGFELTGTGNALYAAAIGVNYNVSLQSGGNGRPIDYTDLVSYAPYWQGGQCCAGGTGNGGANDRNYSSSSNIGSGGPAGGITTGLMGAADAYDTGDPAQIQLALNWMDWDCVQGTNGGVVQLLTIGSSTVSGSNYTQMAACEARAASYDGNRAAQGQANLEVGCYEGGDQRLAPTTSECTTMGISTAYAAKISALLTAHKNSSNYYDLVLYYYNTFMSFSHSSLPAWFNQMGNNQWSLLSGSLYTGPSYLGALFSGGQFQSYIATKALNSG